MVQLLQCVYVHIACCVFFLAPPHSLCTCLCVSVCLCVRLCAPCVCLYVFVAVTLAVCVCVLGGVFHSSTRKQAASCDYLGRGCIRFCIQSRACTPVFVYRSGCSCRQ
jgi:hypothetical protein